MRHFVPEDHSSALPTHLAIVELIVRFGLAAVVRHLITRLAAIGQKLTLGNYYYCRLVLILIPGAFT